MKKIKIAQIGTGHDHAPSAIRTLKLQNELYDVVGFAVVPEDDGNIPAMRYENTRQAYEGVAQMSVEEILNYPGLDAVCIETEDRALTKYAILAAEKGLHIHMDKPGGLSGEEYDRLMDLVEIKQLVFHVGYMYRYNPAVIKLKEEIQAGTLGQILSVEGQMNCRHPLAKRQWLENFPGGMLYFLGSHMIDLIYAIMGEPQEVIPLSCATGLDGTAAEDFGMAAFRYPAGISFAKSTAIEKGGFERRQLVVVGSEGTVEFRPFEWGGQTEAKVLQPQVTTVRKCDSDSWQEKGTVCTSPVYGRYDAMFRAFADYVRGEKKNPFTYEYERNLHRLLLKACGK